MKLPIKGICISIVLTLGLWFVKIYLTDYFKQQEKKNKEQFNKNIANLSEAKNKGQLSIFSESDDPIKPSDLVREGKSVNIVSDSKSGKIDLLSSGDVLKIDLHDKGVDAISKGMSDSEALATCLLVFRQTMDANKQNKGLRIAFIHGKNEKMLKSAILEDLKKKYLQTSHRLIASPKYEFESILVNIE